MARITTLLIAASERSIHAMGGTFSTPQNETLTTTGWKVAALLPGRVHLVPAALAFGRACRRCDGTRFKGGDYGGVSWIDPPGLLLVLKRESVGLTSCSLSSGAKLV